MTDVISAVVLHALPKTKDCSPGKGIRIHSSTSLSRYWSLVKNGRVIGQTVTQPTVYKKHFSPTHSLGGRVLSRGRGLFVRVDTVSTPKSGSSLVAVLLSWCVRGTRFGRSRRLRRGLATHTLPTGHFTSMCAPIPEGSWYAFGRVSGEG